MGGGASPSCDRGSGPSHGTVLPWTLRLDLDRAGCLELAGEQGQNRVVAQLVMIVEILISEGKAHDALPHQRLDRVLRETGIAVVVHGMASGSRPLDLHGETR